MHTFDFVFKNVLEKGYFICRWDELNESLIYDVSNTHGLEELVNTLEENSIDITPKIVRSSYGFSIANIDKSLLDENLVFHKPHKILDKKSPEIVKALFTAYIIVAVAKVDGLVPEEEILSVQKSINSLLFLSQSEKYAVFISALQFMQRKITPEYVIEKFGKLDSLLKMTVINLTKDVVVADGYIAKQERILLSKLYKMVELPTNRISAELERHAKSTGITLKKVDVSPENISRSNIELDNLPSMNTLEQLLGEFEDF